MGTGRYCPLELSKKLGQRGATKEGRGKPGGQEVQVLHKVMVQGCERTEKGARSGPNDQGSRHLQDVLHQKLSVLGLIYLAIACEHSRAQEGGKTSDSISILQMRIVRSREVMPLAHGHNSQMTKPKFESRWPLSEVYALSLTFYCFCNSRMVAWENVRIGTVFGFSVGGFRPVSFVSS